MEYKKTQYSEDLLMRLSAVNQTLQYAVARQAEIASALHQPEATAFCITEEQVQYLLRTVGQPLSTQSDHGDLIDETPSEEPPLQTPPELRENIDTETPFDSLTRELNLNRHETEAVLLCAAPELDRSYERIYAYILDDLNRRYPCVELLGMLTASSQSERLIGFQQFGRFGRLRRLGVLVPCGEAATELRQELRLAPGLLEQLCGGANGFALRFRDPVEVSLTTEPQLPPHLPLEHINRLARGLAEEELTSVGVWGNHQSGVEEVVQAIAISAGKPLRKFPQLLNKENTRELLNNLKESIDTATVLKTVIWIDTSDLIGLGESVQNQAIDLISHSGAPVCLSGKLPWRPTMLLRISSYMEIELETPDFRMTRDMWSEVLPGAEPERLHSLAARFRLGPGEMQAVAKVAATRARMLSNGATMSMEDHLDQACLAVIRKQSHQYASVVEAKRGPDDLVLPNELHRQVLEVGKFFIASSKVDEMWGFGRMASGRGGMKALFTGDSGTGKTLAAEVIAGQLGYPLLKVDLAQVVSKWVGETEKNLEAVFSEAEQSHSVLFFDEADALFGKRGEVTSGTDRYANLEVGYLLQKLEEYFGLVILASNLKDEIDTAFIRRFQVVIHFPRPGPVERRHIWKIAFPKQAPLDQRIDFDLLEKLDLTGAGIVSSTRMAALLAAECGAEKITMEHVAQAVARQYQRESRLLSAAELGPYSYLADSRELN